MFVFSTRKEKLSVSNSWLFKREYKITKVLSQKLIVESLFVELRILQSYF